MIKNVSGPPCVLRRFMRCISYAHGEGATAMLDNSNVLRLTKAWRLCSATRIEALVQLFEFWEGCLSWTFKNTKAIISLYFPPLRPLSPEWSVVDLKGFLLSHRIRQKANDWTVFNFLGVDTNIFEEDMSAPLDASFDLSYVNFVPRQSLTVPGN